MRLLAYIILSLSALVLNGADKPFLPVIEWSGYQAKAIAAPVVKEGTPYNGKKVVRIEAVASGKY